MLDLDFASSVRQNIPQKAAQPHRAQVYVGFQCHQHCGFCYYKHHCSDPMFSLDFIEKQIDFLLKYGIHDFEITGGEPSEHQQLRQICQLIRIKRPEAKIAVITNGGLWKSDCWDLIDEVLLSYHLGKKSKEYDKSMFPLGSTWSKALETKKRAVEDSKLLRTNTVLGTFNLDSLDSIVEDLIELQPKIVNFLPVNLFDEADDLAENIDYCRLRPCLKKAADTFQRSLPDALVFFRYMPFCDMEGYESHILGHLQHIYDWFDWNVELSGIEFLTEIKKDGGESLLKRLGRYGRTSIQSALEVRRHLYKKPSKCFLCKFNQICDGFESSLSRSQVEKTACPTAGKVIRDPLHFIGQQSFQLYDDLYFKSH